MEMEKICYSIDLSYTRKYQDFNTSSNPDLRLETRRNCCVCLVFSVLIPQIFSNNIHKLDIHDRSQPWEETHSSNFPPYLRKASERCCSIEEREREREHSYYFMRRSRKTVNALTAKIILKHKQNNLTAKFYNWYVFIRATLITALWSG